MLNLFARWARWAVLGPSASWIQSVVLMLHLGRFSGPHPTVQSGVATTQPCTGRGLELAPWGERGLDLPRSRCQEEGEWPSPDPDAGGKEAQPGSDPPHGAWEFGGGKLARLIAIALPASSSLTCGKSSGPAAMLLQAMFGPWARG